MKAGIIPQKHVFISMDYNKEMIAFTIYGRPHNVKEGDHVNFEYDGDTYKGVIGKSLTPADHEETPGFYYVLNPRTNERWDKWVN